MFLNIMLFIAMLITTAYTRPILDIHNASNTNTTLLGGCSGTVFGCCHDNQTYCANMNCSNCKV